MKISFVVLAFFISFTAFGQVFVVTPNGLRATGDTVNSYLMIQAGNRTAKQLYDSAISFIYANYSDPKQAIREDIDSTSLKFDTYVPNFLVYNNSGALIDIEAYYTTDLRFFDGRFRYEIINLTMKGKDSKYKLLFKGGFLEAYIIYNKKGKLFKSQTKWDIENYFNIEVRRLAIYITGMEPN